ncbi:MAG: DUF2786 domain-containing protein [Planctomycetes bacterium]|nr:DUF2786 domain-containing protein [Planctomycetota bacterium]
MGKVTECDIENAALRELKRAYGQANRELFADRLRMSSLSLHEGRSRLGYWDSATRTISISRQLVLYDPWYRVLCVLKHEMLHQHIEETLHQPDQQPHGPLFKKIAKELCLESFEEAGLEAAASDGPVLGKIRKLMSLAQSCNPHEADAAMKRAEHLMLKWNIDEAARLESHRYTLRQLGSPGRITMAQKLISAILRDHFFVEILWVNSFDPVKDRHGRVLEICGHRENIEVADYVYHFLQNTAERLWLSYRKENPEANRNNFICGLYNGFHEKLDLQKTEEAEYGLVWLGDPELKSYFARRHPRKRKLGSSAVLHCQESLEAGRQSGLTLVLRRGIVEKSGRGHLLEG